MPYGMPSMAPAQPTVPDNPFLRSRFANKLRANGGYAGQAGGIINQGRSLGYLDPAGSPAIQRGLEQSAIRSSRDAEHRGQTIAQLAGLDPSAARATLAGIQGQNADRTANFLNDATLQEMLGNRDWLRALFSGQLSNEQQVAMAKLMAKLQKQNQGNPLTDILGQAAGAGAGALFGGL